MAVFKPEIKETTEDRLQKAINLGREEVLKEVLEWLENRTIDHSDEYADPIVTFTIFDNKKQMLQSFKERFDVLNTAWLAVDRDGKEIVYSCKPEKSEEFGAHLVYFDNCSVVLPQGSIKKLIRRKLTWDDEPVEI